MTDEDFAVAARRLLEAADIWFDKDLHLLLQKVLAEAAELRKRLAVKST
jgi:hypothetical protein